MSCVFGHEESREEFVTGLEMMAGEEFLSRHAASAFALDLKQSQGLFSTRDDEARFVSVQDFTGLAGLVHDFSLPDF